MELKTAAIDIAQNTKKEKIKDLNAQIDAQNQSSIFLYFDRENNHKDLQKAKAFLESQGKTVYMDEIRYGLDPKDFIYQFHIITTPK